MEATVEAGRDALASVAYAAAPLLSEDRSAVSIVAEVHDDWLDVRYDAEQDGGTIPGVAVDADANDAVVDALLDLRSAMLAGGQPNWRHCVLRLAADWRFRFDVDRDKLAPA